ncbi:hypothetical protein EON81_04215 [bacterium]|nr:MAG: hypothetical protein EON81_04215 [bacterium]
MAKKTLSHRDIRSRLSTAVQAANPGSYTYVSDVWPDSVVYSVEAPGPDSIRQLLRSSYKIDGDAVALGPGEAVVEVTNYETVTLAAFSVGAETVKYSGKIFELGDYPDKGISVDAAAADAAALSFSPVNINSEHGKSLFDGKLGRLNGFQREGNDIIGEVEVPRAVFDLVGNELKVSCEWDIPTKRLTGIALSHNPRITDATLTAAFSKGVETERKGGAVESLIEWVKAKFSNEDKERLRKALDVTPAAASDLSELERLRKENAKFSADLKQGEEGRIKTAATSFADGIIKTDKRALPSERGFIEGQFGDALRADNTGKACFSADGSASEGEAVKRLRDYFANRPKLEYDVDKIKDGHVVFSVAEEAPKSQAATFSANDIYAERAKAAGSA